MVIPIAASDNADNTLPAEKKTMSATSSDVTLLVVSDNARSERRVSPAWTIEELKTRLVAITGIPASSQKLTISISSSQSQSLGHLPETALLNQVALRDYAELRVRVTPSSLIHHSYCVHWHTVGSASSNLHNLCMTHMRA